MSEYSAMTQGLSMPVSYGIFIVAMIVSGLTTWWLLTRFSRVLETTK
jgi:hypothetical protein